LLSPVKRHPVSGDSRAASCVAHPDGEPAEEIDTTAGISVAEPQTYLLRWLLTASTTGSRVTSARRLRLFRAGGRLASGTIWVDAAMAGELGRAVVYARVSSHDQRADLDRQVTRVTEWATINGHRVSEVACEVGSGMNGNRPGCTTEL
jgi:hypothetical protein